MLHPLARPDRDEALKLAKQFNDQLRPEGWELVEEQKIAGRPRFSYRTYSQIDGRALLRARTVADAMAAGSMEKEIERMERGINSDPALAIGTAKELVETCCKYILDQRGVTYSRGADIGDLTKLVVKCLKLVPDGIPEAARGADNIKMILRTLSTLTHNLAELRSMYGTGHGRRPGLKGLQPRHARLAVGAAVTFIEFVSETHLHQLELEPISLESAVGRLGRVGDEAYDP
jgi:hypothetical protein